MFLPREVLFAALIFQLIQSGLSTTSITPSPSLSTPSANSTVPASSNSTTQAPSPPSQSSNVSLTTSMTAAAVSPGGGGGVVTSSTGSTNVTMVTQTPSPNSTVTTSASSVKDVVWYDWKLEKPNDCDETCCKTGGVVNQIRNCTINVQRCNLTLCENYGVTEREVLCQSACKHCSSGRFVAGSALTIFVALLFQVLLTK